MKKHFLILVLLVMVTCFAAKAQQQAPLGRFIIGTSPLAFSMNSETTTTQYYYSGTNTVTIQTDTTHTTNKTIAAHINLFVGYFVTKNICAGLQFSANSIGTYSAFIRYYFNHKRLDSAKFDFFIQANGTFSYSNTDHPYQDNLYTSGLYAYEATTDYKVTETTLDFGVGLAAAYHLTRHWALEAEAGYIYKNSIQNTGSYSQINGYFTPPNSNPQNPVTQNTPSVKSTGLTNEAALRFMLTYRI